ncbi:Hpt domain-containing protein [Rheinheimera sp. MMS21-TC3]|uniref:Hpt domain-containing protein n=1 Tax=Rheinheimera sp. MMS21-TC3 TaxID=3072790 RepID=UPI0028C4FB31|nr:Hpt domain-containing protein [Rheinheimera sp. MMS21-TC3]WNO60303.1 Hpt domain-containing protein [Rheinheimera sp. MMS21-TC3]
MNILNTTTLKNLLLLSHKNQAPLLNSLQNMVDNCSANIAELDQAFKASNKEVAKQLLHKIRGSFATIGADAFANSCADIELQLQREVLPSPTEQAALFALYQDSCQVLQQFVQQHTVIKAAIDTEIDLRQLLHLLQQQNMAATALANKGASLLNQLLPSNTAADFFKYLAQLNYTAAAELLIPYVEN